jgi:hypothetical protein
LSQSKGSKAFVTRKSKITPTGFSILGRPPPLLLLLLASHVGFLLFLEFTFSSCKRPNLFISVHSKVSLTIGVMGRFWSVTVFGGESVFEKF